MNTIEVMRDGSARTAQRDRRVSPRRGDRVRIVTGGGGGWGDPEARDLAASRVDVRTGCSVEPPPHLRGRVGTAGEVDERDGALRGERRDSNCHRRRRHVHRLVALDEKSGAVFVGKALTTPRDPSIGVVETIRQAVGTGLDVSDVSFFVHGGTIVINAITERKGVKTALVTTRGFRDVIAIGRGNRPDLYNLHSQPSAPFVPRCLCFEATERLDARGKVRVPIVMDEIDAIAGALVGSGVAAVAVLFLHAYANPVHEAAAATRLRERLPGVAVTASHEVSRQWREFERTNTAVLSAYVKPIMSLYLANLDRALADEGLSCPSYCMQSNGGLAKFRAAEAAPLALVESGPSGGVAGAVRIGERLGEPDILYFDVGGTTAKCSLVRDGRPVLKSDYKLEWTRLTPGYPCRCRSSTSSRSAPAAVRSRA